MHEDSDTAIDRLDRTDVVNECSDCGSAVTPDDDRASLVIEGAQYLLCGGCGRDIRDSWEDS